MLLVRNSVIEKPSFIKVIRYNDFVIIYDYLLEQRFELSSIAYEMFIEIDGEKRIYDISKIIAERYNTSVDEVTQDTIDLFNPFIKSKVLFVKESFLYKYIKIYYKLIFFKTEEDKCI